MLARIRGCPGGLHPRRWREGWLLRHGDSRDRGSAGTGRGPDSADLHEGTASACLRAGRGGRDRRCPGRGAAGRTGACRSQVILPTSRSPPRGTSTSVRVAEARQRASKGGSGSLSPADQGFQYAGARFRSLHGTADGEQVFGDGPSGDQVRMPEREYTKAVPFQSKSISVIIPTYQEAGSLPRCWIASPRSA